MLGKRCWFFFNENKILRTDFFHDRNDVKVEQYKGSNSITSVSKQLKMSDNV